MKKSDLKIAQKIRDGIQLQMVARVRKSVIKVEDQAAAIKNLADMADLRGRLDAERGAPGYDRDHQIDTAASCLGLDPVFLRALLSESIGLLSYPNMDSYHLEQLCRRSASRKAV